MLKIDNLETGYGASQVLFGINMSINEGEVATLLGRNGMGKTTTVRSIFGLLAPRGGSVRVDGREMAGRPPHAIGRAGLGLV
ncbi:MAG: ATP-binding cassette domain-containing protein, partial [Chloroflexota bacterium]